MNIVLAFVIIAGVFMRAGTVEPPLVVGTIEQGPPAAGKLQQGDALVAVDGKRLTGDYDEQVKPVSDGRRRHKGTPVTFTVDRDGQSSQVTGKHVLRQADPAALPLRLRLRPGGERRAGGPDRAPRASR